MAKEAKLPSAFLDQWQKKRNCHLLFWTKRSIAGLVLKDHFRVGGTTILIELGIAEGISGYIVLLEYGIITRFDSAPKKPKVHRVINI